MSSINNSGMDEYNPLSANDVFRCDFDPMYFWASHVNITSALIDLTVLVSLMASTEPPSGVAIQPDPVLPVVLSQSVDLMCTATGDPPITYAWVLTGAETTRLNSDPTSGNFTLNITQMNQYGVYICIATNVLGTDATSIEITQASKSILYNSWAPNPRYLWALSCSVSRARF